MQGLRLLASTLLFLIFTFGGNAQTDPIGQWKFESIRNLEGTELLAVTDSDYININDDSTFVYELAAKNNLLAKGKWQIKSDTLAFIYSLPTDTTRYYYIKELSDTLLVINEGAIDFGFKRPKTFSLKEALGHNMADGNFDIKALFRGLLGLFVLVVITYLFSADRKNVDWPLIVKGLLVQFVFALGILKVPFVRNGFDWISQGVVTLLGFTEKGSEFLFGGLISDVDSFGFIFAFQVLPTVIFFSALTSLLFYYGILQRVVYVFAWVMKRLMKLSGAESLAAAGNIFLGQTESPLLVKPYISKMTKSELLCLMSGGMATIAGGVLMAYINFLGGGDMAQKIFFTKHLLAASVMSAPAAVVAAKILLPETEKINEKMEIPRSNVGVNALEAISNGTTEGLKLAVNVGAMLLVFIAFIAMANYALGDMLGEAIGLNSWVADITGGQYESFSLQFILGYVLAPVIWLMGVANEDLVLVGQLLGEKTIFTEFVAYTSLGDMANAGKFASLKSIVIATYILCGFSNFASIGIQIGGIGSLAPSRKGDLSKLGFRALVAGSIASLFTAVIVGMLI